MPKTLVLEAAPDERQVEQGFSLFFGKSSTMLKIWLKKMSKSLDQLAVNRD